MVTKQCCVLPSMAHTTISTDTAIPLVISLLRPGKFCLLLCFVYIVVLTSANPRALHCCQSLVYIVVLTSANPRAYSRILLSLALASSDSSYSLSLWLVLRLDVCTDAAVMPVMPVPTFGRYSLCISTIVLIHAVPAYTTSRFSKLTGFAASGSLKTVDDVKR